MADRPNLFVARLFERSESLVLRADVAVETARHLRLCNRRLRTHPAPESVDEITHAKLRKALLTSK